MNVANEGETGYTVVFLSELVFILSVATVHFQIHITSLFAVQFGGKTES